MHKIRYKHEASPKDIVKVKVHLEMKHVPEWDKIRSQIVDWAVNEGFVVNTIQPIVAYEQSERAKVVKSVKKSDLDYLNAFVKRAGADERTVQVGKDLLVD